MSKDKTRAKVDISPDLERVLGAVREATEDLVPVKTTLERLNQDGLPLSTSLAFFECALNTLHGVAKISPVKTEHAAPPEAPRTCTETAARVPFRVGDVVRLKSETRWMTLVHAGCVDLECGWFDRWGELHCESFHIDTLTASPPERADELPF